MSGQSPPDVWENRIRYEETDRQDLVFYGNYVTYQDETVSEFLRQVGYDYAEMRRSGWDIHVVSVDLDYRGQATFDDWIVNAARIERIGESSMTFEYAARRADDGTVLVEGSVTHVAVDEATGEPVRIPDAFRDAVVAFQNVPPEQP